jgi:hypothetical protein
MRHFWQDVDWRDKKHPLGPETRRCTNCGVVQELSREHLWGRVVSRRWVPLVGRRKPLAPQVAPRQSETPKPGKSA